MSILLTMTVLTTIVLALTLAVLAARRLLIPSGEASILVNDSRSLRVPVGGKLLWALADQGIRLPAACGGRGSCGQCRVVVERGGGEVLLTETGQLSRRELADRMRLACMVTVYDDLAVQLPEAVLDAKRWPCRVRSNVSVSTYLTELTLDVESSETFTFVPGSYVLLEAPAGATRFADFDVGEEYEPEWRRNGLFELSVERDTTVVRAYSLANGPDQAGVVQLVIRVALPPPSAGAGIPPGQVSSYAFSLKPGDRAYVSGPFGTFRAMESEREMVFIGGGAGIAPLRSMIYDQLLCKGTERKITFFYGARSLRDLCYRDDFDDLASRFDNFAWYIALSDPQGDEWTGPTGFVHALVQSQFLHAHRKPEDVEYYICGPPVMASAVVAMLEDFGVGSDRVFLDDFGA